ncbi:hypothetical protein GGX14DRAFT_394461 [Mycena pura]|uniref:Uncharacterized protein n=1 Tax=Mycena pura TaxID=153505 RepID=A0AAD6YHU3_9AGAR|nr:hypothetical protein GGX14DRAFT_394461 [Mycena pura]
MSLRLEHQGQMCLVVMQRFPQELIDLVLDQVADSDRDHKRGALRRPPPSITTCGLVCKQWLPRSRLHVFSTMVLFGSRLRSLLDLEAKSSSLSLLSLARHLFLVFWNDISSKDMSRLRTCLNLTHLELCFPPSSTEEWDLFLGTHLPFLGAHCVSLSSLKLSPCEKSAVSLRVIVDILVCLPSLSAFQLEGQSCSIIEAEIPLSHSCPPCLQTLKIEVKHGAEILFGWFLSLAVGLRIKSLTLLDPEGWDNPTVPTADSLVSYFQRFGSRLEFLAIWPHRASFNGNEPSGILKYATSLRHLKLYCQPVSSVLTMLSALPSSNLFTLAIELDVNLDRGRVDTVSNMDRVPYALIDEALAHPRFHSLKSFSLGYGGGDHGPRSLLTRNAKALMPLAKARRILHRYHA